MVIRLQVSNIITKLRVLRIVRAGEKIVIASVVAMLNVLLTLLMDIISTTQL